MAADSTLNAGAVRDDKGRMMHPTDSSVVLDPRRLRSGKSETHIFPLIIDKEQLQAVPGVDSVESGAVQVTCRFQVLDDCIVCSMTVDSEVSILDESKLKYVVADFSDSADLTLSKDPEMADVLPDQQGRYDLTSNALALFYSSIPSRYSSTEQEVVEGDGYEVISEDEYNRRKRAGYYDDNPFKHLDPSESGK